MLAGKRILITGVITRDSIAYHVAERAQRAGAEVILTGFGRSRRMTERSAARLPETPDVLELDANRPEDFEALAAGLRERWDGVDGALHAIAFAPADALGGGFMDTPADSAGAAFATSAYSLKALAASLRPLFAGGAPAGRSWRWTSTPPWPGPRTTGWAWRRPRSKPPALPGPRPRPGRRAREPGLRRAAADAGGQAASTDSRSSPERGRARRRSVGTPATLRPSPTPPVSCSRTSAAGWRRDPPRGRGLPRHGRPARGRGMSGRLLLTGATGFVGMEVLARYLGANRPGRGRARQGGRRRRGRRAHRRRAHGPLRPARPPPLRRPGAGGARRPHGAGLGLEPRARRTRWPRPWSHVIHAAASVLFDLPLDGGARDQRGGDGAGARAPAWARERVAPLRRTCPPRTWPGRTEGTFSEADLDVGQVFRNSYERSKHEAERLVRAHARGSCRSRSCDRASWSATGAAGGTASFNVLYRAAAGLLARPRRSPCRRFARRRSTWSRWTTWPTRSSRSAEGAGGIGETYHLTASADAATVGDLVDRGHELLRPAAARARSRGLRA